MVDFGGIWGNVRHLCRVAAVAAIAFACPAGAESIDLTDAERAFVQSAPPITVCVDPDWEPFEVLTPGGDHVGIAADLLRLAAQRVGLRLSVLNTRDWDDSIDASKAGRCQVMSFLNQTAKRDQWLIFTEPLFSDSNVFITREEHAPIDDPAQLSGESIVFPRGTAMEERIRKDYPNLTILTSDSEAEAIAMVSDKRAHMTMRSLIVAAYVIKKEGLFNLKIAGLLPNYTNKLRVGVLREQTMLRDVLNKGVHSITRQDTDEIVNRFVSVNVQVGVDTKLVATLIGGLTLVLLGAIFWVVRMGRANRKLALSSHTDSLTDLPNRAKLNMEFPIEFDRAQRYSRPFSLIMLDLDHFKQVNDRFGHLVGDQVLVTFARVLQQTCRNFDIVGRWGGEEFLVLCPETTATQAEVLGARICQAVRQAVFATGLSHTVSAGIASISPEDDMDSLLHRADAALYQAKRNGRDQVVSG